MDKNNQLETAPIGKLVFKLAIPTVMAQLVNLLYNIVDRIYVGRIPEIGSLSLAGLGVTFPIILLVSAFAMLAGMGGASRAAVSMGEKDNDKAEKILGNCTMLLIIFSVVLAVVFMLTKNQILMKFGASEATLPYASDYISIYLVGTIFVQIALGLNLFITNQGFAKTSMMTVCIGAVLNIVLDPIFIYVFRMGVKGAAYATVIGQIASCIVALVFHLKLNKSIKNGIKYMKPSIKIIGEIYAIGFPAIIAQALMSAMTYGFNIILVRIDEAMVTAYGLFYKIQQFILFAAFGLRDAITPIISFNHGKGDKERVKDGIKYGMLYTFIIMVIGIALLEIFALPFSAVFGLSGTTQSLCVSAMRIIAVSFIFAGANIAYQGIFQALQSGIESLIISVCRQILFVLPIAWGFSFLAIQSMDNAWLVWLTFPISEIISAIIGTIFMININKKKVNTLSN